MKTKRLGNSDLFITPMGFGAWAIGGAWGNVSDDESLAALNQAIDSDRKSVV